jgi:uncharacterized protein
MTGLSRTTATVLSLADHVSQSITDILSTPIGSRVMRRDYGSDLPNLIDAPLNGDTLVDVFAATAEAIDKWEPRFALRRVDVTDAASGRLAISMSGELGDVPTVITAEVLA